MGSSLKGMKTKLEDEGTINYAGLLNSISLENKMQVDISI